MRLTQPTGLMRALIEEQLVTSAQVEQALRQPAEGPLGPLLALIELANLTDRQVAMVAAQRFGVPVLDIEALDLASLPAGLLDADLMQRYGVLALARRKGKVEIAVADPSHVEMLDAVRFQTGQPVEPIVVPATALWRIIEEMSRSPAESLDALTSQSFDFSAELLSEEEEKPPLFHIEIDDAPVVKFIHKVLYDAINEGASDIHFEPYEREYRIRFRTDGELRTVATPPVAIKDKIAARIKIMARLDISERRLPQDGRIKMVLSQNRAIDFRVSTLPTLWGEKVVLRLLDPTAAMLGIEALGYEPEQLKVVRWAISRPYGMILVTGPTGSGKTVTLYTLLGLLNQPHVNICTAEDPVEINLAGINQVQINEKTGLTFASALRAFLRQDPDIVMVGEIRDLETAEMAVKAAQTGHLVFSTLHTNDAPATLDRLRLMGIAPFNIAASVLLITAQRLVRRLCSCKIPLEPMREELLAAGFAPEELEEGWTLYGPKGCSRCHGSGYKGRTAIHEVLPISEAMRHLIVQNASTLELQAQARREGIMDLRRAGLLKVKAGITSLAEVLSATNE